ncbi:MAG: CvpA family protein [Planctomycetales bacterium]
MGYDLCMLGLLAYTTIRGASKGIAWQLAAIAALVLCFAFATPLSLAVAPAIHLDPPLNRWVAMLGIYLGFSFGCFAIARMARGWLEALKFEEYDRHLGALFGLLKGATLCLVITFFSVCLIESARGFVLHTRTGRLAGQVFHSLRGVMPAELDSVLAPYLKKFEAARVAQQDDQAADFDLAERPEDTDEEDFRGSSRRPEAPSDDDSAQDAGETQADGDLIDRVVDAIGSQVKESVSDLVHDTLAPQRESGRQERSRDDDPDQEERPPNRPRPSEEEIQGLVQGISRLFSRSTREQSRQQTEIETLLHGIPPVVAKGVLLDWRADLLGTADDPDSETDVMTPLDHRLLRQLARQGVDLEDLPRPVRERLRESE